MVPLNFDGLEHAYATIPLCGVLAGAGAYVAYTYASTGSWAGIAATASTVALSAISITALAIGVMTVSALSQWTFNP